MDSGECERMRRELVGLKAERDRANQEQERLFFELNRLDGQIREYDAAVARAQGELDRDPDNSAKMSALYDAKAVRDRASLEREETHRKYSTALELWKRLGLEAQELEYKIDANCR